MFKISLFNLLKVGAVQVVSKMIPAADLFHSLGRVMLNLVGKVVYTRDVLSQVCGEVVSHHQ